MTKYIYGQQNDSIRSVSLTVKIFKKWTDLSRNVRTTSEIHLSLTCAYKVYHSHRFIMFFIFVRRKASNPLILESETEIKCVISFFSSWALIHANNHVKKVVSPMHKNLCWREQNGFFNQIQNTRITNACSLWFYTFYSSIYIRTQNYNCGNRKYCNTLIL